MKNWLKKQFKIENERIWNLLVIFTGGLLLTEVIDGFINKNYGQIAGYFTALIWFSLYVNEVITRDNHYKKLAKYTNELVELVDSIVKKSKNEQYSIKSDKGGIPSPFFKKL